MTDDLKTRESRIDVAIAGAGLLGTRAHGEIHPEDPYLDASEELAENILDEAVRTHAIRLGMAGVEAWTAAQVELATLREGCAEIGEDSNLVAHARRELALLEEDPEMAAHLLALIGVFARGGHSGSSAAYTIARLTQLLSWENLTPLTDDPEEWQHHTEEIWGEPGGVWQSRRRPDAFSTDAGKTYYLVDDKDTVLETVRVIPSIPVVTP